MQETMMMLTVVTDIAGHRGEGMAGVSVPDQGVKLVIIGPWTTVNDRRQGQVRASVYDFGNLGKTAVFAPGAVTEVRGDMP